MEQKNYRWQNNLSILAFLVMLFGAASTAYSAGSYLTTWSGIYPSSTSDNASCQLCHASSEANLNPYGKSLCDLGSGTNITTRIQSVATADSDGEGSSNVTEINANTQPGWTTVAVPTYNRGDCSPTGSSETAAQAGVSGLLDPPAATTTTTTLPSATTTTLPPATTTTLPSATTTTLSPASTTTTTLPPDLCPDDPNKTDPGVCGCNKIDVISDFDGDNVLDCNDNAPYDPNPLQTDTDLDGIGDAAQLGPNGNDPNYDGNTDGTPDSQQNYVSSLSVDYGQKYVTLATDANNILEKVATRMTDQLPDPPAGVNFPSDLFEFTIKGVGAGGSTTVTIYLPEGEQPTTYWKYGPTPSDSTYHWYEFLYDGTTGAEFNGNVITLHFVDGDLGDDDLLTNGIIDDLGGPAIISAGSSSSSGCFIATAAYGSYWEPHVMTLRQFRDSYLLTNTLGTKFVETYYRYSPPMADYIAEHDTLRTIARIGLAPIVGFSWLTVNYGVIITLAVFLSFLTLVIGGAFLLVNRR